MIKYICIETCDRIQWNFGDGSSKQFTKGDIYYISITPEDVDYGAIYTESGYYIMTLFITTFSKYLMALSEYREAQIQSVLN